MATSELNKWSLLDGGKWAHWWVGAEGTACGRDFKIDIRQARDEDPRCGLCMVRRPVGSPA